MRTIHDEEIIRSEFASDEDMAEIIGMFVEELPSRIAEIQDAFAKGDSTRISVLAHQLKGAAGGYGFSRLGAAAALVDQGMKDKSETNVIRSRIGTLAALAVRIRK